MNLALNLRKHATRYLRRGKAWLVLFILSSHANIALIMFSHQICDLHHLRKVVGDILLVVYAEEAVGNIVVYFLLVFFQILQNLHLAFNAVGRLLILTQLVLESIKGALEVVDLLKVQKIGIQLLISLVYLFLDIHDLA